MSWLVDLTAVYSRAFLMEAAAGRQLSDLSSTCMRTHSLYCRKQGLGNGNGVDAANWICTMWWLGGVTSIDSEYVHEGRPKMSQRLPTCLIDGRMAKAAFSPKELLRHCNALRHLAIGGGPSQCAIKTTNWVWAVASCCSCWSWTSRVKRGHGHDGFKCWDLFLHFWWASPAAGLSTYKPYGAAQLHSPA